MLIASIKEVIQIIPIQPGSLDDLNLFKDQVWISLLTPDHIAQSGLHEKGKITLIVDVLSGSVEGINEVVTISDEPMNATLLRATLLDSGMFEVEVYFDQIFVTGFETSVHVLFPTGGGLAGLSEMEKAAIDNLDFQRHVFDELVDIIFDSHRDEIKALPLPCLLLDVVEMNPTRKSCYFSRPNIPGEARVSSVANNEQMMHVATICKSEIAGLLPAEMMNSMKAEYLSFYLKKGTDEEPFAALENGVQMVSHDEVEWIPAHNPPLGHGMAFRKSLDLPRSDHSSIFHLQFSPIEVRQYEALEKTFKKLIRTNRNSSELNKLFGYPDNIQNCVAYWAERQFSQREHSDDIFRDAAEWQLLLQLSPYKHWFPIFDAIGDANLYFMIRKKDWMEGNFNHIQLISQST
ncbi:MAG: DUF1963 domain-containing protein [Saprospiraceae bacterium]|nr:DUF1963 domain-containing protein [Saprospiraceae bacterium]